MKAGVSHREIELLYTLAKCATECVMRMIPLIKTLQLFPSSAKDNTIYRSAVTASLAMMINGWQLQSENVSFSVQTRSFHFSLNFI